MGQVAILTFLTPVGRDPGIQRQHSPFSGSSPAPSLVCTISSGACRMRSNCQNGGRHSRIKPPHRSLFRSYPADSTESNRFAPSNAFSSMLVLYKALPLTPEPRNVGTPGINAISLSLVDLKEAGWGILGVEVHASLSHQV
uniref:Uncharacterized protein n=2 Tax=Micrurus surinamensis TaxID=129470 RepID=A0A2D4NKM1_MICSU